MTNWMLLKASKVFFDATKWDPFGDSPFRELPTPFGPNQGCGSETTPETHGERKKHKCQAEKCETIWKVISFAAQCLKAQS
jgi:hypothetical protein